VALITVVVLVVAAVGLGAILVQNATAGSGHALVTPSQAVPAGLAHDRSLGKATAPVKLDEWEDFQCPYCDQYTLDVEPHLISQYVTTGQLQITYHDYSFIGAESFSAAVAARCAGDQGQFWAYMEYLFSNQGAENGGTFNQAFFDRVATTLGLNQSTFDTCLSDPAKMSAVQAETNQGKQLGISGTPTLFVNGTQYTGGLNLSSISAAIDAALQAAPASAAPGASPAVPSTPASPAAS
jgi:protein-disulfide isomerase